MWHLGCTSSLLTKAAAGFDFPDSWGAFSLLLALTFLTRWSMAQFTGCALKVNLCPHLSPSQLTIQVNDKTSKQQRHFTLQNAAQIPLWRFTRLWYFQDKLPTHLWACQTTLLCLFVFVHLSSSLLISSPSTSSHRPPAKINNSKQIQDMIEYECHFFFSRQKQKGIDYLKCLFIMLHSGGPRQHRSREECF